MSDQINMPLDRRAVRSRLLSTVSVVTLICSAYGIGCANAADSDEDRPTVWIELGGQAESISGQGSPFAAPFMINDASDPIFKPVSPLSAQKPPEFSFGEEAKLSFQPEGSDWIFSAAMRYGRSGNRKSIHQQTAQPEPPGYLYSFYSQKLLLADYAQFKTQHQESHTVLDFQAGKDVGLGLFGTDGKSIFNVGVRMAQFSATSTVDISARPHFVRQSFLIYRYTNYSLSAQSSRNFHGIGPSLSWNASLPVEGNRNDGELTVDWGANAAALFGRQAATIHHRTVEQYQGARGKFPPATVYQHTGSGIPRSRSVTVPNLGGFAGISYRFSAAAISLGYRADFFFGAIDGGIDTKKSETLGFTGPFATVSIGLGG